MKTSRTVVRVPRHSDRGAVRALLATCGLPLAGLDDHWQTVWIAANRDEIVGCVALEVHGSAALLRSLAVAAKEQGRGLGQRLLARALAEASRRDVTSVVLLTETARAFFAGHGFEEIQRHDVPPALTVSAEFRGACPQSATAMRLSAPAAVTDSRQAGRLQREAAGRRKSRRFSAW